MDFKYKDSKYPSAWVINGLTQGGPRAHLKGLGITASDFSKPFIGVVNCYNEMHPGHVHLGRLAGAVRDGIHQAGGVPFEFHTIGICDGMAQGHRGMCYTLPSREIIADSIEVTARGQRLDGLVFLCACDKSVPGMLMAMVRLNLPSIMVTGGPMMPGRYGGREYATYELKEAAGRFRRGLISEAEFLALEDVLSPGPGSCAVMGTANSMSIAAEALGLTLPGSATAHAVEGKKLRLAKDSGRRAVDLIREDLRPRQVVTARMLETAARVVMSVGGSTNTALHLPAIAREAGLAWSLEDIDRIARTTPYLAKIKPSGDHTLRDLEDAGGVPVVMKELSGFIDLNQPTLTGMTMAQNIEPFANLNPEVIRPADRAYSPESSLAVLKGNLAPHGAVVKQTGVAEKHALPQRSGALFFLGGRRGGRYPFGPGGSGRGGRYPLRRPSRRAGHAGDADRHLGFDGHGTGRQHGPDHGRAVFRFHPGTVYRPHLPGSGPGRTDRGDPGRGPHLHRYRPSIDFHRLVRFRNKDQIGRGRAPRAQSGRRLSGTLRPAGGIGP